MSNTDVVNGITAFERFNKPTEEDMIRRAAELRPLLREQQAQAESEGHYTEQVHQEMLSRGLYHVLTPKKYGGLEFSFETFLRIVSEISRGDPGSGWCYCLGHGHALSTASLWGAEVQEPAFMNDSGYFIASHSLQAGVVAERVEGGYVLSGRSAYQSGIPFATHATVNALVKGTGDDGSPPVFVQALVPADKYTVDDDWGGDKTIGMRASGSNAVLLDGVFLPDGWVVEVNWLDEESRITSAGAELHDNPMYLGVAQTFLQSEMTAIAAGTALAAIDEYEEIVRKRVISYPPFTPRIEDPQHQRDFGDATMKADSAEGILLQVADRYLEYSTAAFRDEVPYTRQMDVRLFGMLTQSIELSSQAVELLYRSSGASAARKGSRMERYYRDVSMVRTHLSTQFNPLAQRIGAVRLGVAKSIF